MALIHQYPLGEEREDPKEHFIVVYADGQEQMALKSIAHYASNVKLDFSWYDAAKMAKAIRDNRDGLAEENDVQ